MLITFVWHDLVARTMLLPQTREALESGVIGWSTAELLARHLTAETELEWLEKSRGCSVRELRALLARSGAEVALEADDEPTRTLTVTATREDGWMLEGARKVAEAVARPVTADRFLHALLAEGYSTLLDLVPEGDRSMLHDIACLECDTVDDLEAHAAWCTERRRWQNEAEERCEACLSSLGEPREFAETKNPRHLPSETPEALDREIRRLCSELSERDLALGIVADGARKAEVWRRLGFASEAQYARERVGVSLSSLKAKRILAARAGRVPELATALSSGRVGYEAAYLLSRVVTPKTAGEWIRRAEQRTVKHLREEVEAAELLIRMGLGRDQRPLDGESLDKLFELERSIVSGDLFGRASSAWAGDDTGAKARGGAPAGATHRVGRASRVLRRVPARRLSLHEPRLHTSRRDAASPHISLARRGRRRRKRRIALRLVPPSRRSRRAHWRRAACVTNSLANRQNRDALRRGANARSVSSATHGISCASSNVNAANN
jgi:hypothetical protein